MEALFNYVRNARTLSFALALAITIAASCMADTIPPSTVFLQVDQPGGPVSSTSFGVLIGGGNTIGASAAPTPSLNAQSVDGGGNTSSIIVQGNLTYYFEIVNTNPSATDTSIPVDMTYLQQGMGPLPITSFAYDLATEVQLIESDDNVALLDSEWNLSVDNTTDLSFCSNTLDGGNVLAYQSYSCTAFDSLQTNVFNLLPNTIYQITLADDIYYADGTSVQASVDPYLQFDSSFADSADYSIVLSNGIGNSQLSQVPEPSHLAVTLMVGLLGLTIYRNGLPRRRS